MDEILDHLGALNYCNSWDFRDLRWCKISSISSRYWGTLVTCGYWGGWKSVGDFQVPTPFTAWVEPEP